VSESYDLIIVGGGSAGLTAAGLAVQLEARVALVEKDRIGGDCTWTGCVPSKTLLKAARVAHEMRTANRHGLPAFDLQTDLMKGVMNHVRDVVAEVYHGESPDALRADGIDVILGPARFLDPRTLAIGETTLTARRFLIATGAHPVAPPIAGIEEVDYLTYQSLWNLDSQPSHLLVVGGGPVGCEMSQAFGRLGSGVTLIQSRPRLLPRDEPEASRVLAQVFESEGIDVRLGARVERAWQDEDEIHLLVGDEEVVGDTLLMATGRRPNLEGLDLERAGVTYGEDGIQVDDQLRTSQQHIYAAGDCTGGHQFTHYAGWQAFMAARNALLPGTSRGISDRVPWTTFTDPEVAHLGLTQAQAGDRFGDDVMTCEWPMERVDRARTEGDTTGFIKLVHKKDGTLLGISIVAARAGEMLHEWILALDQGLKVGDVAQAIHVYPTYATASMQAAAAIRVGQLLSGTSGRVVRGLARLVR
jgi:pyruvate/2-oxoglutarate dehydrogenase complex dihydrolipoamide dehydrogenase (E3) component